LTATSSPAPQSDFPRMLLYSPSLPHHFLRRGTLATKHTFVHDWGRTRGWKEKQELVWQRKKGSSRTQKKINIAASKLPVAPRWQVQKTQVPSFCSTPSKSITHTSYKIVAVQVMRFTLQEMKQHLNLAFSFFGKIGNGCTLEWLWSQPASHRR
jgi:hypothetical protein